MSDGGDKDTSRLWVSQTDTPHNPKRTGNGDGAGDGDGDGDGDVVGQNSIHKERNIV